jgi:hypothetical protein
MLSLILSSAILAPQAATPPPQTKEFAFWVGEWNCEGTSYHATDPKQNQKTTAENKILMAMNGYVVHENFKMGSFEGQSWSVYNPQKKKWQQSWADNQGGYFALEGAFANGKMTLQTLPNPARPKNFARMVFSNIKPDSFDWNWQRSTDGGKSWKTAWHLRYTRKP